MNSSYYLNCIMGNLFGTQTTPPLPTQHWIGLSASEPLTDGTVAGEPGTDGTGYSRVRLDSLSIPMDGEVVNTAAISFPESISSWGTMLYYIVFDAQVGGNLLFHGALSVSRNVEPSTVITIKAGELSIKLRNPTVGG